MQKMVVYYLIGIKKNNFEYKPYTTVQDNTYVAPKYVAPRVVIPSEQNKK